MINALNALNKMKLMILLCKTLYCAWFDVYDARHKQKKSNSFLFVLRFPHLCVCSGWFIVILVLASCCMWSLILAGNFYNEDNKSSHENSSQKLYLRQFHIVWKVKISKTERRLKDAAKCSVGFSLHTKYLVMNGELCLRYLCKFWNI